MKRRALRRMLAVLVIAVAIIVVVLLVLIGAGVLVLPAKSPAPVTIDAVHLVVHQGNTSGGVPWLGDASIYYNSTNSNYPLQVAPGGSWTVDWTFINFDNHYHNITGVIPRAPFTLGSTQPTIPVELPPNAEGLGLGISVVAPNSAGASYPLVTIVVEVDSTP
jgi:hypothetical protein